MRGKSNRNRVYFGIMIFAMLAAIAFSYYGMLNIGKTERVCKISVIVNDSGSDRWIAMRQGIRQAADDFHIDLNYATTGNFQSAEDELAAIQREVDNGAEGIIVQPAAVAELDVGQLLQGQGVSVMFLESDIEPQEVYPLTAPDNYALGGALAEAFLEEGETSGLRVGLLYETPAKGMGQSEPYPAMRERLAGARDALMQKGIAAVWELELASDESQEKIAEQTAGMPVDVILALGNDATEEAVDYLLSAENGQSAPVLYGIGCSEKVVYYLDRGVIRSLVAPDEFKMGYQSVAALAEHLTYPLSALESNVVDYLVVNRKNLYDEENQKQLFPIVQ